MILKTGDLVEIKTAKNSTPSEGWLDFVKTTAARSGVRKYIAIKNAELLREDKIAKGKQSCIDSFHDRNVNEEEMMKYLSDPKLLEHFEADNVEELFIKVAGRKPSPSALIEYCKIKRPVEMHNIGKIKSKSGSDCPVYCKGVGKIALNLANCCTPIPGDDISGYITKGKGITVHRKNCPNIAHEKERLVDVYWRDDLEFATYPVDIVIECSDRNNLLVEIIQVLTANKVSINSIHARLVNGINVLVSATLMVSDAKRLSDIFNILRSITGVYEITRVIH